MTNPTDLSSYAQIFEPKLLAEMQLRGKLLALKTGDVWLPIGAKFANFVPQNVLKKAFAVLLILIALKMFFEKKQTPTNLQKPETPLEKDVTEISELVDSQI